MTLTVYGGEGGGLIRDLKVYLVFKKGQYADLLRQVFPSMFTARPDGSVVYSAAAGDPTVPAFLEKVEVESPTITAALYLAALAVALLLVLLFRRK